ncbi:MAG: hypothetical protein DME96_04495 [Verrucomicrobia bacterium]|nr:MAG: hypothetical protein DME96_04495 [Verrucomicrobiota bacterium]
MLPRRPSVSLSTAIDESASVHSGLAHRSIRFPIAGSDFCADAKAAAKKYTALTIGARFFVRRRFAWEQKVQAAFAG